MADRGAHASAQTGVIGEIHAAFRTLDRLAASLDDSARRHGVSARAIRAAPSWAKILELFYEAGAALSRAEHLPDLEWLEAEARRLDAEERHLRAELDASGMSVARRSRARRPGPEAARESSSPIEQPAAEPPLPGWVEEMCGAVAAIAASDVLLFVLDDVLPPERRGRWPRCVERGLLHSRDHVLCQSAALVIEGARGPAPDSYEQYLMRFTGRIIGLPRECWSAVAEAVWQGRWREADSPCAYVKVVAQRGHRRAEEGLDPRSPDVFALAGERAPLSLDAPLPGGEPTDDPVAALVPDPRARQDLDDVITRVDWERTIERAGLDAGLVGYAQARLDGDVPRVRMAEHLGVTPQRAAALEKQCQRMRDRLREALSA